MSHSILNGYSYDVNSCLRIKALLQLEGKALLLHDDLVNRIHPEYNCLCSSFYSALADVVKLPLVTLVNDEATASLPERIPVKRLMIDFLDEAEKLKNRELLRGIQETQQAFCSETDFLVGSLFLDLAVNVFSCFEVYLSKIYDFIRLNAKSSNSKIVKLKKYIEKYNKINDDQGKNDLLNKIMADCSSYISGKEKMDYVISRVDKNKYCGDLLKDREIVSYIHKVRNTVHSGGVNTSDKSYEIEFNRTKFSLAAFSSPFVESFDEEVNLFSYLCDIYKNILSALSVSDPQFIYVTRTVNSHSGIGE